jgi:hypothetical protein
MKYCFVDHLIEYKARGMPEYFLNHYEKPLAGTGIKSV